MQLHLKATDYIPPSKRVSSLSTNQPLEPLEATDGDAAAPTAIKPTSKAAAIGKVSKRKRDFLVPGGGPTSGDEMPPPKLLRFSSVGLVPNPSQLQRPAGAIRRQGMRAHQRRPLTRCQLGWTWHCKKGSFPLGQSSRCQRKSFLRCTHANAIRRVARSPWQSFQWHHRHRKTGRIGSIASFLTRYGDSVQILEVLFDGMDESSCRCLFPRSSRIDASSSIASCALRSDSNSEFRWSCWACQLNPEEARLAGFSPSKSCWHSDAQQLYHWWGTHAKQSHWDWLREAESFHVTHKELVTFLLGCDLEEWPLPWTTFALDAIPRELPQKLSGHNPRVFEPPFLRKVTSANAPSELYRYAAVPKKNRPVSPENRPPSAPRIELTELGWTDPIAAYSKCMPKKSWLSS